MGLITLDPDMGPWYVDTGLMVGPGFAPASLTEMAKLWSPGQLGIANVAQPGLQGDLSRTPTMGSVTHAIEYEVSGDLDQTGSEHDSIGEGIDLNYADLVDTVGNPFTWGGPHVGISVERPSGAIMIGLAQPVVSPILSVSGGVARCVVSVTLPFGELVAAGS